MIQSRAEFIHLLHGSGVVNFSNNFFSNGSTEVFPGSAQIKEIIIAEDRIAVYAISTSNVIFKY